MTLTWWGSFSALFTVEARGAGLHQPARWATLFVTPLAYFCLLGLGLSGALGGPDYLSFVAPGVIVMQAMGGLSQTIYRMVIERRWGLAALKLQSGVPLSSYLASVLAPRLIVYLAQSMVIAAVASLFVGLAAIPGLVLCGVAGLLVALFWNLLGLIITGLARNYQTRDFIVGIIVLPLTFAAPVFYRIDTAPLFVQLISVINPLRYQVDAIRGISEGRLDAVSLAVSAASLAVVAVIAWRSAKTLRYASFEG